MGIPGALHFFSHYVIEFFHEQIGQKVIPEGGLKMKKVSLSGTDDKPKKLKSICRYAILPEGEPA